MSANYVAEDFTRARDWVRQHGGHTFPTFSSFEWFLRSHRRELIQSGEIITRRGAGGTLVGPGFGRLAVEILQRRQRQEIGHEVRA